MIYSELFSDNFFKISLSINFQFQSKKAVFVLNKSHIFRIKHAFTRSINNVWSGGGKCLRENQYEIFTRLKINWCSRFVELWTSALAINISSVLCKFIVYAQGWRWVRSRIHNNCEVPFSITDVSLLVVARTIWVVNFAIFVLQFDDSAKLECLFDDGLGINSVIYNKKDLYIYHCEAARKKYCRGSLKVQLYCASISWVFLNYFSCCSLWHKNLLSRKCFKCPTGANKNSKAKAVWIIPDVFTLYFVFSL